jgi:hypothetical protein
MIQYTVIWIEESTRRKLKKAALEKEISMRELATTILNAWIDEGERNITAKQPDAVPTRTIPDA